MSYQHHLPANATIHDKQNIYTDFPRNPQLGPSRWELLTRLVTCGFEMQGGHVMARPRLLVGDLLLGVNAGFGCQSLAVASFLEY
jgi:hypothetical protein